MIFVENLIKWLKFPRKNEDKVVYGLEESSLLELTGDNPLNPTMSLSCQTVLHSGQKKIEILGPMMEQEIIIAVEDYWKRC